MSFKNYGKLAEKPLDECEKLWHNTSRRHEHYPLTRRASIGEPRK
jgi:hypothetical protein